MRMVGKRAGFAAMAAGAAVMLAGCGGGSYEDSRALYEELQGKVTCDSVESDAFSTYTEGELAESIPAFDVVAGGCALGDDDISVDAVVPHDVTGEEFLSAFAEKNSQEGYALVADNWILLVDEQEPEAKDWLTSTGEELGGEVVTISAAEADSGE